jgi:23S rRNA pseudouridine1911/1915/1917 synthase
MSAPSIIYEDNHLLIVQKPPGSLAQPDGSGRPDLLTWAGDYLARNKTGRAFVGLTHRLDRAVGGVMALAKTSKAAARLSREFRERRIRKLYLALVTGSPPEAESRLGQLLVRDGNLTRPAAPGEAGSEAVLTFRLKRRLGPLSLLEVDLETGFKHQIRAQLASMGFPVAGDVRYRSPLAGPGPAIGLWARTLTQGHPTRREELTFTAEPADLWPWSLVG